MSLATRLNAALQGLLHIQQLAAHADETASPYYQIREAAQQATRDIHAAIADVLSSREEAPAAPRAETTWRVTSTGEIVSNESGRVVARLTLGNAEETGKLVAALKGVQPVERGEGAA